MKAFTKNSTSNGNAAQSKASGGPFFGVQAKLAIGKADDPYERQADTMAEQVVSKKQKVTNTNGDSFFSPKPNLASQITPGVQLMPFEDAQLKSDEQLQTKCAACEAEEQAQTKVQLMPFEDVQAKFANGNEVQLLRVGSPSPGPDLANRISNRRGQGNPLPEQTRSDMESGFGADFSGVNVHTDTESAQMNDELGAQAFTSGNDIFFNEGQFDPQSESGQTLLAHELTHTIQQGASQGVDEETQAEGSGQTEEGDNAAATEETAISDENQAVEGEVPAEEAVDPNAPAEGEAPVEGEGGTGEEAVTTTPRSPEEDPNFQQLEGRVEDTATAQQDNVGGTAAAGSAQGAAASPANERASMAEAGQVDAMEEAEAGEFSAEDFKARLMERIESMQLPASEEEADDFEDNNNIDEVTQAATGDVQAEQAGAAGAIEQTTGQEPNAEAIPEREVTPLEEPPIGDVPQSVNPDRAMPPARGRAEVNTPLEENMSEVDGAMEEAEVTDEMLANSNEPKFTGALENKQQAKEHTENAPNQLRQQEQGVLQNAQINANNESSAGLNAMHGDRTNALNTVNQDQQNTGQTDTAERQRIADEINAIFERTKTDVETILSDLDTTTSEMFQAGADVAKQRFENYVERKMDAYKDERYSGIGGAFTWVGDAFTGLPDEVNQFFVDGRQVFIDHMDGVITRIAQHVADKLNEAKTRITEGKQEVQDYVTSLPENLQQIGSEAAEEISSRFDELEESVNSKQEELIDSLADQYTSALEEVDARIEEMQAANRGLIDMALGAIMGVIQTIIDIKNMLTELLVGAANAIMTIISDPIGFLSNLFGGIKQGFEQFGSNILTHLQTALIQWLTGALGPVGITIPDDLFSLQGIFSLVAQILGLTWDYIRQKAVRHLGEPVVVALETGFEIFQVIRTGGMDGLWEYIKEKFNDLKETVIDGIKEMVISTVIEAGIKWVLGLLNPASAFVKACMMIIDVVRFFIERGSQIIELVRAFIEGVNAVASGNVTAVANAIENALARALPVIIGFLASLLGISGLARKVTKLIGKIRKRVDKAVDKLIMKAKAAGRRILARLGIGRNPDGSAQEGAAGGDGELGKTIQFNDGDESHRLWVDETGPRPVLKVASTPKTVEEKVAEWRTEIAKPEWNHGNKADKKARIISHLTNVESKLGIINQNITQAENSERQGNGVPEQVDNTIEQNETTVSQSLRELFKEFKETQDLNVLYADEINQSHDEAKTSVVNTVQTINDAQQSNSEIRSFNGLTDKIKETPTANELFTNPINNGQPYGNAVRAQIDRVGADELKEKWPNKKDNLISKMTSGTHVFRALVRQILNKNHSTVVEEKIRANVKSDADHNKFKPTNIQEEATADGGKKITYQYAEGAQRFEVTLNAAGYPVSTTGSNLSLHDLGRGTTQDSTGKVVGANQDSAHLIANMFGGSGFNVRMNGVKTSLNLMATSDRFNRVTMLTQENRIKSFVLDNAANLNHFDLTVNVTWANENDSIEISKLIDEIKKLATDDERQALVGQGESEIRALIQQNLARTTQPRVMDVVYDVTLTFTDGSTLEMTPQPNTGPDLLYGAS